MVGTCTGVVFCVYETLACFLQLRVNKIIE